MHYMLANACNNFVNVNFEMLIRTENNITKGMCLYH